MKMMWRSLSTLGLVLMLASSTLAQEVMLKISGPGAVDSTTIKAGEPVSFDFYYKNDDTWAGFVTGFILTSEDIAAVKHVADPELPNAVSEKGEILGFNGWENKSVWDFGFWPALYDWDENLPEQFGFAGLVVNERWKPHDWEKKLAVMLQFDEPGTIVLDSAFFPPGGKWQVSKFPSDSDPDGPNPEVGFPGWSGPYTFTVVE